VASSAASRTAGLTCKVAESGRKFALGEFVLKVEPVRDRGCDAGSTQASGGSREGSYDRERSVGRIPPAMVVEGV
jgi:hypothetical protein